MANLDNSIIIGRNIKNIRKDLDLTQEDNAINICNTANCSSIRLFKDLIKSPDIIDQYELLTDRDKSVINKMITVLLNTK